MNLYLFLSIIHLRPKINCKYSTDYTNLSNNDCTLFIISSNFTKVSLKEGKCCARPYFDPNIVSRYVSLLIGFTEK